MRRTRLAAAGAAAAIALSGTVAAADDDTDTQTVTINVEALARTVTTDGDATFTITAGAAGDTAVMTGDPTIAYTNGTTGEAKITAQLTNVSGATANNITNWTNGLGNDLSLRISLAAAADGRTETSATGEVIFSNTSGNQFTTGNLLTGIPTNVDRSATAVAYTLEGTAPSTAASTELTFTFTITDN